MLNLTIAIIASIVVMLISIGAGIYLVRYKSGVTEMLGMMIGMTQGMMTGIIIGYFIGAATDMFIGNLVGVIIGLIFGVAFGRVGDLMGMMDGGMGGMMGGMMGAMLGVMLQYLYDGMAITFTSILISIIYLVSMIALVRLVQRCAVKLMEIDLVCNMEVDPKTCLQHTFQNETYFFCGPSCRGQFVKTPETYIKKEPEPQVASVTSASLRSTPPGENEPNVIGR
jgi:YHS domain-containing protein